MCSDSLTSSHRDFADPSRISRCSGWTDQYRLVQLGRGIYHRERKINLRLGIPQGPSRPKPTTEVRRMSRAECPATSDRGRVDVLVRRRALLGLARTGVYRKPMALGSRTVAATAAD